MKAVSLVLADGVQLPLQVADGATIKQLKAALATLLGKGPRDVAAESNGSTLGDDDSVPETLHLVAAAAPAAKPQKPKRATPASPAKPANDGPKAAPVAHPKVSDRKAEEKPKEKKEKKEAPKKEKPRAKAARESVTRPASQPAKLPPSPELEEARKQVSKLTAKNIQQMIGISSPPEWLVTLLEHVVLAYGLTVKSWDSVSKELSDVQFIKKLQSVDPHGITDRNLRKLESFKLGTDEEELKKVGGVCSTVLHQWMLSMVDGAKKRKEAEEQAPKASHHSLPLTSMHNIEPPAESPGRSATPVDASVEAEELLQATKEVAKLDAKDVRDLRTQITSTPVAAKTVHAVQAALGQKDTSAEAGARLILNPKAFQTHLNTAANDPAKNLKLSRAEFLQLQKCLRDPALANVTADVHGAAVPVILRWAKGAHAYAGKFQKRDTVSKEDKKHHDPAPTNGAPAAEPATAAPAAQAPKAEAVEVAAPAPAAPEPVPEVQPTPEPEPVQQEAPVEPDSQPMPQPVAETVQQEAEPVQQETPVEPEPAAEPEATPAPEGANAQAEDYDETY